MSWTLQTLARWTGAELRGDPAAVVESVSTDTRALGAGSLFVALRGENFDGHDYVPQAVAAGTRAVLVDTPPDEAKIPALIVPETLGALGAIANAHRRSFPGPVIAITGSNGKTTTKELCADILEAGGVSLRRTPGNLNNHIGLPLSILGLGDTHRALVVELGMNHPGEIDQLAAIAEPSIGAITQVARAHLGPMGSLEAIAQAKGELLDHIGPDGVAVLNADDERVMGQAARSAGRVVRFGFAAESEYRAVPLTGRRFRLESPAGEREIEMRLPGRHLVSDGLCAAACADQSGLLGSKTLDAIGNALENYRGSSGRLMLREGRSGVVVLDDSYNANPRSMRAALETLEAMRGQQRSIAVLADMLELGPQAPQLHTEVGTLAGQHGVDIVIGVGEFAGALCDAARGAGCPEVVRAEDALAANAALDKRVRSGDVVLVKGSRGMRMERTVDALLGDR